MRKGFAMGKIFTLLLIFLVVFKVYSSDKQFNFKRLTTDEGLSNGWVKCIYQDDYDFIWVGTVDGLNRYDGISFKNYRPIISDGIEQGNITIYAILKKDAETLWVCTDLGLFTYNYQTDEFSRFRLTDEPFPILTCAYDNEKNLWLGSNRGVIKVNPNFEIDHFFTYNPAQTGSISNNYINRIFIDSKNRVWIGTKNGLNLYNPQSGNFAHFQALGKEGDITGNDVMAIAEDKLGHIWIGTALNGVNLLKEQGSNYSFQKILDGAVVSLLADSDNYLWVGHGTGGGLTRINPNNLSTDKSEIRNFKSSPLDPKSISENSISCFLEDKNKDIWIGTFGKGLNFYSKRSKNFKIVEEMNGSNLSIGNNLVNTFYEEKDFLWIGTEGGLDRKDKKTGLYKHYEYKADDASSLSSNQVFKIYKDSRGNLWIGTWAGGLHRYDYKNNCFKRFLPDGKPGSISNGYVFSIIEDHQGNLWIATDGGGLNLYNYETETFTAFQHEEGNPCSISDNFMDHLFITSSGELIISLYSKINKYNRETGCFEVLHFNPNQKANEYQGNTIFVYEDSKKNLWFGTDRGLFFYNTKTRESKSYTVSNGLPDNTIQSVEEDRHGHFWLGTNKGLSFFAGAVNVPDKSGFVNFTSLDGLPSNDFKKRSSYKNSEGYLFFGTSNGYVYFHPDSILTNSIIPNIAFTQFILHNPESPEKNKLKPIINNINNFERIELKYGFADFTIHFASLNYLQPEANKYLFKLEGYDKEWIGATNQTNATYTNIKPGVYSFIVYGSNNDGGWTQEPKQLKIEILPPWWENTFFRVFVFLTLVLILVGSIRIRVSIFKKRNLLLQEKIEERTGELVFLNNQLKNQKEEIEEKNNELFKHQNHLEGLVKERTKELEKAKEHAEESDRLKSSFLANLSHEIRTPLNSIMGFASLLPDEESKETMDRYSEIIVQNAEQLVSLIDSIVLYSKLQTGLYSYQPTWFEPHQMLKDILHSFDLPMYQNEVSLIADFRINKNIKIYSDYDKLRQIITNLISNAFKYTAKGEIVFGCELKDYQFEFFVKDSGIGIPQKDIPHIFDRFYRGSNINESKTRGTGLGLSIVQELIELLGGSIWVESEEGKGSSFIFTIPSKTPIEMHQ